MINWEDRVKDLEVEFGTNAKKHIYSSAFGYSFIKKIGQVYLKKNIKPEVEYISDFGNRSWLNFPGPFYTVVTDNCGIGQPEAPDNILYDEEVREHVFRQPRTVRELSNVFSASYIDPFQNYGIDGNEHWDLALIKTWWAKKGELIKYLQQPIIDTENDGQNRSYIEYLNGEAESDLRKYAYFLEFGSYPENQENLPELS